MGRRRVYWGRKGCVSWNRPLKSQLHPVRRAPGRASCGRRRATSRSAAKSSCCWIYPAACRAAARGAGSTVRAKRRNKSPAGAPQQSRPGYGRLFGVCEGGCVYRGEATTRSAISLGVSTLLPMFARVMRQELVGSKNRNGKNPSGL